MHPDHDGTLMFTKSSCSISLITLKLKLVHGCGTFVHDTCGTVTLERATGETSDTGIVVKSHGHS